MVSLRLRAFLPFAVLCMLHSLVPVGAENVADINEMKARDGRKGLSLDLLPADLQEQVRNLSHDVEAVENHRELALLPQDAISALFGLANALIGLLFEIGLNPVAYAVISILKILGSFGIIPDEGIPDEVTDLEGLSTPAPGGTRGRNLGSAVTAAQDEQRKLLPSFEDFLLKLVIIVAGALEILGLGSVLDAVSSLLLSLLDPEQPDEDAPLSTRASPGDRERTLTSEVKAQLENRKLLLSFGELEAIVSQLFFLLVGVLFSFLSSIGRDDIARIIAAILRQLGLIRPRVPLPRPPAGVGVTKGKKDDSGRRNRKLNRVKM